MNQTSSLLVNGVRTGNHWVAFQLSGTKSNRDGIGAKLTVHAGDRDRVDEVRSGSSYISQNAPVAQPGRIAAVFTPFA